MPEEDLPGILLEDCWNRTKAVITSVAESVLGYVEPGRRNDWFDGECQAILAEKDAARKQMLLQGTRQNVERYKQKRKQQTRIFQDKKRRLEEVYRRPICVEALMVAS